MGRELSCHQHPSSHFQHWHPINDKFIQITVILHSQGGWWSGGMKGSVMRQGSHANCLSLVWCFVKRGMFDWAGKDAKRRRGAEKCLAGSTCVYTNKLSLHLKPFFFPSTLLLKFWLWKRAIPKTVKTVPEWDKKDIIGNQSCGGGFGFFCYVFQLHFLFLPLQLWAERSFQQIQRTDILMYSWSSQFSVVAGSCRSLSSKTLMLLVSHFTSSGQQPKLTALGVCPFFSLSLFIHCSIIFYNLLYICFCPSATQFWPSHISYSSHFTISTTHPKQCNHNSTFVHTNNMSMASLDLLRPNDYCEITLIFLNFWAA